MTFTTRKLPAVPGVLLRVQDTGLLLQGESGSGKSELALGLLDRGHQLVADDAVELDASPDGHVIGYCPQELHGLLEVRGLGIVDVARVFGPAALATYASVQLIVRLVIPDAGEWEQWPRLHGRWSHATLLGHPRPRLDLPTGPGRPMPLLLETAVRQWQQRRSGEAGYTEGAQPDA